MPNTYALHLAFEQILASTCARRVGGEDVASPEDWKGRIDARILVKSPTSEQDACALIAQSVQHYTATEAEVEVTSRDDRGSFVVHVCADGYRAGPAGG